MAIEFGCGNCQSVLRTADNTAGKKARCPNCGNLETVPPISSIPADPSSSPANPFGKLENQPNPYSSMRSDSPYQPPNSVGGRSISRDAAKSKLLLPAIFIIVVNSVGILFWLLACLGGIAEFATGQAQDEDIVLLVTFACNIFLLVFSIYGATCMMRMTGYRTAMAAAITTILSGFCCCFLPTPFGIWAIVVLADRAVSQHFG